MPVRCSTNWTMKPHIGSKVSLLSSFLPVRYEIMWSIYEIIHIWTAFVNDWLRWSFFTFIYNRISNMVYFIYTLHDVKFIWNNSYFTWSIVYWSWSSLVHTQVQRGDSHKTSPYQHRQDSVIENSRSMDAHDQETGKQENRTTVDRRGNSTSKQRGSEYTNYKPITVEHPAKKETRRNHSTPSPYED